MVRFPLLNERCCHSSAAHLLPLRLVQAAVFRRAGRTLPLRERRSFGLVQLFSYLSFGPMCFVRALAHGPAGPCRAAQSVFYAGMRDSMTLRRARFFFGAGGGQTSPTPPPRRLSLRPGCGGALRVGFVASDGGIDASAFCFRRRHPSRRHCRVVRLLSVGRESLVGGSVQAHYGRGASAGPGAICRIGGRR